MKFQFALEMGIDVSSVTSNEDTEIKYTKSRVMFTFILKEEYSVLFQEAISSKHTLEKPATLRIDSFEEVFERYQLYVDETRDVSNRVH